MTKKVPIWLKDMDDNFIHVRMDEDGFFYIEHSKGIQVYQDLDKMNIGDVVKVRGVDYTVSRNEMVVGKGEQV